VWLLDVAGICTVVLMVVMYGVVAVGFDWLVWMAVCLVS
jgi:hypothetical protein